jgi:hypothetical protein
MPERELQRLSDSYPKNLPAFAGMGGLELEVVTLNVNDGRNKNLVTACNLLHEYCIFIDTLRCNLETMNPKAAVQKTVEDCIARDVLKDFLQKHRRELVDMLVTEWDWDIAMKVSGEENYEKGVEVGVEKGMEKAARAMKDKGYDIGAIAEITGLPVDVILGL